MYRKATSLDGDQIYHLICDMENKKLPYDKFCQLYQKQLASKNFYCLVCEIENKVAGVLNLRLEGQLHHAASIAEIMEFIVAPAYRNRGIGKEMLAKACETAKEFGCVQIEVACNQLRTDTHRFYLREGMRNFHYKFSKSLTGDDTPENRLGK